MADDQMFPFCKHLLRLSKCTRVPTNKLQHWTIRKQPPCLSEKTGPETRTYVPSSFRVQSRSLGSDARFHIVLGTQDGEETTRDDIVEQMLSRVSTYCVILLCMNVNNLRVRNHHALAECALK